MHLIRFCQWHTRKKVITQVAFYPAHACDRTGNVRPAPVIIF